MNIIWDNDKAKANEKKHGGVSFEDAQHVLMDSFALTSEDTRATEEQRFITLGMSAKGNILVVVYTYREDTIRLISAWKANRKQQRHYEKQFE